MNAHPSNKIQVEIDKIYNTYKSYLFSIAYDIIGEIDEAEDVVHDSCEAYIRKPESHVQNTKSYLSRIVANKAIDRLKRLQKQRSDYKGIWLPEPYIEPVEADNDPERLIMDYAVLSALEALNPTERAVFVLKEAFDFPYHEISEICDVSETNCRKILSRIKQKLPDIRRKNTPVSDQVKSLMEAFMQASIEQNAEQLKSLLKDAIESYSDGGGKVPAALNPLFGKEQVSQFFMGLARKGADMISKYEWINLNNYPALWLQLSDGTDSIISMNVDGSVINKIFVMRNPDKIKLKKLSQNPA